MPKAARDLAAYDLVASVQQCPRVRLNQYVSRARVVWLAQLLQFVAYGPGCLGVECMFQGAPNRCISLSRVCTPAAHGSSAIYGCRAGEARRPGTPETRDGEEEGRTGCARAIRKTANSPLTSTSKLSFLRLRSWILITPARASSGQLFTQA